MIRKLLLCLLACPPLAAAATDRPNILILMAEDLSPRIGVFGDPVAQTPNIDRLAASGSRFPNTFTTAGVCAPSRAAHITGMHQASIGAQHMRSSSRPEGGYLAVPPPEVKAYPELLRRAGYYTLTNGKLDYQFSFYGAGSGPFTIWDYEGDDPDWNRRADGQPFFALINFSMTHESRMFPQNVEKQRAQGWRQITDPADVVVPPYYPDTPVIRRDIAQLYDNVHEMDRQVGEWLAKLKDDGLADDTIVIWTTDHGDGLPRGKREIYDSGIKVPLVVHWPERWRPAGADAGGLDERLLSFIDFAPSVLRWAGVEAPGWLQGLPVLADSGAERDYVFAAKDRLDEIPFYERAARDDRYKYIVNYLPGEPGGKPLRYREQLATMQELHAWYENGLMSAQQAFWFEPRPREELYDLALDPHEVNNLAEDPAYAAELERMRAAMSEWRKRVPDASELPEAVMAESFWPGGEQPRTPAPCITIRNGRVALENPIPGASIAYRIGASGGWQLYSVPFEVRDGVLVEAKAVRYGWAESEVAWLQAGEIPPTVSAEPAGSGASLDASGFVLLDDGRGLRAAVAPAHGGELAGLAVTVGGEWRELVYRAMDYSDTNGWRGKAPFLWPAVGITLDPASGERGFRVDGRFYPMPAHGFARDHAWRLRAFGRDGAGPFAALGLSSDPETRVHYPFDFELTVEYRLADEALRVRYTVEAGEENGGPMPFAIGNHVTFRAPLLGEGDAGDVRFHTDLPDQLIRGGDRAFSGRVEPSPFRGEQPLSALPRRNAVSLGGTTGPAELTVLDPSGLKLTLRHEASAEPSPPSIRFNLWADTEEGFFSPEPWLGTQNALNNGAGLLALAPGDAWFWTIEITPGRWEPPSPGTQEDVR